MITSEIIRFLDTGLTSTHVAREISAKLTEAGSRELNDSSADHISPGDVVHVVSGGSVAAFHAGDAPGERAAAVIAAAHTDSPGMLMKERSAELVDGFLQIPVEVYGGPIIATWIDRELMIAGHVALRGGDDGPGEIVSFSSRRAWGVIPNLAIHFNREMNDSLSYNRQDHLKVLIPASSHQSEGENDGATIFRHLIAEEMDVSADAIIDMELFVLPAASASAVGPGGEMLVSGRIDNLAGCISVLDGFLESARTRTSHGKVALFFDHEEIGSTTSTGAAGNLAMQGVRRFLRALYGPSVGVDATLRRSVLISNDCAHARHPNYRDKHDGGYAPRIGGGPVIKKSAIRRYATDLAVAAWFASACERAGFAPQYLQNRSDIPAGSTIGPAVASRLTVPGVDVGVPMLAMHSARETASVSDIEGMARVLADLYARGYSAGSGEGTE